MILKPCPKQTDKGGTEGQTDWQRMYEEMIVTGWNKSPDFTQSSFEASIIINVRVRVCVRACVCVCEIVIQQAVNDPTVKQINHVIRCG